MRSWWAGRDIASHRSTGAYPRSPCHPPDVVNGALSVVQPVIQAAVPLCLRNTHMVGDRVDRNGTAISVKPISRSLRPAVGATLVDFVPIRPCVSCRLPKSGVVLMDPGGIEPPPAF